MIRRDALIALRAYPHAGTAYPFGASIHFTDRRAEVPAERQQAELRSFLESRGLTNVTVDMTTPTVEDTFMDRMGDPANQESAS